MAQRIPLLQRGALVGISDESIAVGTRAWFAWLETATTFRVLLDDGHFTARKERASNGRGGLYWRAYRRQHGRLLRSYLGTSGDLSLERLREAAARLTQPAGASISPRRGSSVEAARRQTGHLDNQERLHREDDGSNAAPPLRLRLLPSH